jgi:hypothetical protein
LHTSCEMFMLNVEPYVKPVSSATHSTNPHSIALATGRFNVLSSSSSDSKTASSPLPASQQTSVSKSFRNLVSQYPNRPLEVLHFDCRECEYDFMNEFASDLQARHIVIRIYEPSMPEPDDSPYYPKTLRRALSWIGTLTRNHYALYAKDVQEDKNGKSVTLSFIQLSPEFWQSRSLEKHTDTTTQATNRKVQESSSGDTFIQSKSLIKVVQRPSNAAGVAKRKAIGTPYIPDLARIKNAPLESFVPTAMLQPSDRDYEIPHHLLFTYCTNLLREKLPSLLYENVNATVHAYRQAWQEPDAPVWFLTDRECEKAIAKVRPHMLPLFLRERRGSYKADICRIAALYWTGGYYFDVDLRVMEPVRLDPDVSFATVEMVPRSDMSHGYFFQAFIAVAPRHPLLLKTMDAMEEWYRNQTVDELMGPKTMRQAFDALSSDDRGLYHLLHEINLEEHKGLYPGLPRQIGHGPGLCNYIVHDTETQVVHFFSRIIGSASCKPVLTYKFEREAATALRNSGRLPASVIGHVPSIVEPILPPQ